MKLLQQEVDITPGRPGMRPPVWPVPESQPIPGSAVVRLTNTTKQENAYTIRLRCDQPFWQEPWCAIIPLPAAADSAPPTGKADQRGPHDSWAKVYVPRGGTRDILLRFNVPRHPDSRAGRYPFIVEVETQIVGPAQGMRRSNRVTQIPGSAIVRPFYKWEIDMQPEQPRVGIRRRSTEFEVTVTNESNDWLYCDLKLPRPKDFAIESPTLRLAVPPPEPGEMLPALPDQEARPGTQRTVPLRAATKLRVIRGDNTAQSILLNGARVDAPSVALPLDDGTYPTLGAVVAEDTDDTRRLPGDRALVYCPPIPARLTDFFQRLGSSFRGLLYTLLAAVALLTVGIVLFENAWHNNIQIQPLSTFADPGGTLNIQGRWLDGAKVTIGGEQVAPKHYTLDLSKYRIAVPADLNGKKVKLKAQRFVVFLPFLTPLLPSSESADEVQVGKPPATAPVAQKEYLIPPSGSFHAGDHLELMGGGLGTGGTVYLGGMPVAAAWKPDHIGVSIPASAQPGPLSVSVVDPNGNMLLASTPITIVPKALPTPPQPAKQTLPAGHPAGGGSGAPTPAPSTPAHSAPAPPRPQPVYTPPAPNPQPAYTPPAPRPQPAYTPPAQPTPTPTPALQPKQKGKHGKKQPKPAKTANQQTSSAGTSQATSGNAEALRNSGIAAGQSGDWNTAISDLTQAHQQAPNDPDILSNLLLAYVNQAVPLGNSRQYSQAAAIYSQGVAVYNSSTAAAKNDPKVRASAANVYVNLGIDQYSGGNASQARSTWNTVVSQFSDTPWAKAAQQYLNQTK